MALRYYLILMSTGSLLCWLAWLFVIGSIDPKQAGIIGFFFFYASLFLALTGTFSVIGFLIRKIIVRNDEAVFHHVKRTFRQGVFIASIAMLMLLLQHTHLFRWWNALLLVVLLIMVEGLLFTTRKFHNRDRIR